MSAQRESAPPDPELQSQKTRDTALPQAIGESSALRTYAEFWHAVQQNIKDRLGLRRYSIWFKQTELMSVAQDRLVVGVPNAIILQFLAASYTDAVAAAAEDLVGHPMAVSFDVAPSLFRQMRADRQAESARAEGEPAAPVRFQPRQALPAPGAQWGFQHLIATRANRLPFAAARELAGQEKPRFRFLYVSGDYGVGKSTLLRAMFALASGPGGRLNCIYASAEDWCNEYYHAIQSKTTRPFRSRHRSCDLFLLDDIQFIQGKAGGQAELLHTVKHILDKGGRVALSSTPHAAELQEIGPAFRALLRRAFPAVMLPPDEDERHEVVRQLARKRGLQATGDVHEFIARAHGDSFTKLESAISCLLLYAGVEGCGKVDLTAAMDALAALQPAVGRPVGLVEVKEAVAAAFGVSPEQLAGRSRCRTVCRARHAALHLSRRLTGASLTEIGRAFGGLSHSSVKYGIDKTDSELGRDARLSALVGRIEKRLRPRA